MSEYTISHVYPTDKYTNNQLFTKLIPAFCLQCHHPLSIKTIYEKFLE